MLGNKLQSMLKATIKRLFPLVAYSTVILLFGCSTPEEKRAKQEENAQKLVTEGQFTEALKILEELAELYPNDIELLTSIGEIYLKTEDFSMAAFFLEQAHLKDPDNVDLLLKTYAALEAANQPSILKLEKLAELSPESMSDDFWITLGMHYTSEKQTERALKTLLRGTDLQNRTPDTEVAVTIGQLFLQSQNFPQAEKWFAHAATSEDPNALTALFGLLDLQLRQKRWPDAEATIATLDEMFPGAVDASQWKKAREELTQWRAAQERMKAKLAKLEAEKKARAEAQKAAEAKAKAAREAKLKAEKEAKQAAEILVGSDPVADEESTPNTSKAQILEDMDAAEAMANQPAVEAPSDPKITYDPSIQIEPADPNFSFSVEFEEQPESPATNYSIVETPPTAPLTEEDAPVATTEPKTFEELLADAETAEIDRNFKSAIQKYWAAIRITRERPDVWNRLARAYLVDGQLDNAETAALEAIRVDPNEVSYTLDYLRVTQRSRPPEEFLSLLETAYDRFPANPELTLSLARAHERVSEKKFTARNLYQRFLEISPNHPLATEAREAIERLR